MYYFFYSISFAVSSWIVGLLLNEMLRRTAFYENLTHLNFITSKAVNKRIGLGAFKWIVKNTFFKYFNQKLKIKSTINMAELTELRKEMTVSEISHLIGFAVVCIFALIKFIQGNYVFGMTIMISNTILNLYPSLLQQENKRRIDKFLVLFNQKAQFVI